MVVVWNSNKLFVAPVPLFFRQLPLSAAVVRATSRFSMPWLNALLILCPVIDFFPSMTSAHPRERLSLLLSESLTFRSSTLSAFLRVSGVMSDL